MQDPHSVNFKDLMPAQIFPDGFSNVLIIKLYKNVAFNLLISPNYCDLYRSVFWHFSTPITGSFFVWNKTKI
jgi:hypothetical protein